MNKLKNSGEITKKTTNKFTLITVVNYGFFQDTEQHSNEQLTNNQRTINEQSTSIEEECKEREECKNNSLSPISSDDEESTLK